MQQLILSSCHHVSVYIKICLIATLVLAVSGCGKDPSFELPHQQNPGDSSRMHLVNQTLAQRHAEDLANGLASSLLQGKDPEEAVANMLLWPTVQQSTLRLRQYLENDRLESQLIRELRKLNLEQQLRGRADTPPTAGEVAAVMLRGLEMVQPLLLDFFATQVIEAVPAQSAQFEPVRVVGWDWSGAHEFVRKYDEELARLDPRRQRMQPLADAPGLDEAVAQMLLNFRYLIFRMALDTEARPVAPHWIREVEYGWGDLLDLPSETLNRWLPLPYTHIVTRPPPTESRPTVRLPVEAGKGGAFSREIYLHPGVSVFPVWGEVEILAEEGNPMVRLEGKAPAAVLIGETAANGPPFGRLLWLPVARTSHDRVLASAPVSVARDGRFDVPRRFWGDTLDPSYIRDAGSTKSIAEYVHYTRFSGGNLVPPASMVGRWESIPVHHTVEFSAPGPDDPPDALRITFTGFMDEGTTLPLRHHPETRDLTVRSHHPRGGFNVWYCEPLDVDEDGTIDVILWGGGAAYRRVAE